MKHLIHLLLAMLTLASCNVGVKKNMNNESSSKVSFKLEQTWMTDTVFRTPESVVYDSARNQCYVSNINRGAGEGNGFISRISPDGKILDLKWVEGLKGPKGLAIAHNRLYAADIDQLVEIDMDKGIILQRYKAFGSSMLNDAASDGQGNVYVSDSDTSIIYEFHDGSLSQWLNEGLNHPNGLYVDSSRLLVASDGDSELKSIDMRTKMSTIVTRDIQNGDGITWAGYPGYWLVSDWAGEIYIIYPDHHKVSLLDTRSEKINSADITYIPSMNELLVPTFNANRIMAYKLVRE